MQIVTKSAVLLGAWHLVQINLVQNVAGGSAVVETIESDVATKSICRLLVHFGHYFSFSIGQGNLIINNTLSFIVTILIPFYVLSKPKQIQFSNYLNRKSV